MYVMVKTVDEHGVRRSSPRNEMLIVNKRFDVERLPLAEMRAIKKAYPHEIDVWRKDTGSTKDSVSILLLTQRYHPAQAHGSVCCQGH